MREKVLVISASSNKNGNSVVAGKWFVEEASQNKYEFEFIHLYDLHIDKFTNENRNALIEENISNKDIRDLINKIEAVNKIIITTPIWNFGVPSQLKLAIDRMSCSGRIWCNEKQKKIPGWCGKRFYLIFTTGSPWYGLFLNRFAIGQLYWTLWYFGAKRKIIDIIFNCGNGNKLVIDKRENVKKRLNKKGKQIFK